MYNIVLISFLCYSALLVKYLSGADLLNRIVMKVNSVKYLCSHGGSMANHEGCEEIADRGLREDNARNEDVFSAWSLQLCPERDTSNAILHVLPQPRF